MSSSNAFSFYFSRVWTRRQFAKVCKSRRCSRGCSNNYTNFSFLYIFFFYILYIVVNTAVCWIMFGYVRCRWVETAANTVCHSKFRTILYESYTSSVCTEGFRILVISSRDQVWKCTWETWRNCCKMLTKILQQPEHRVRANLNVLFNLLPHTRIFCPKIAIFSQF